MMTRMTTRMTMMMRRPKDWKGSMEQLLRHPEMHSEKCYLNKCWLIP